MTKEIHDQQDEYKEKFSLGGKNTLHYSIIFTVSAKN
jgi:hypothetical protein